jgi:PRC-barrel domain protein
MREEARPQYPVGKAVVSAENGNKIGKLVDVRSDGITLAPEWLVVDPGPFRAAHYVPARSAYRSADGSVVVPFTKSVVTHSPAARDVLTPEVAEQLRRYYGVAA